VASFEKEDGMKKLLIAVFAIALIGLFTVSARAEEKVLFSFEKDTQNWEVPEWVLEQQDYVAKSVSVSKDVAKDGASSLMLTADFPGKVWTAALVETSEYFDWTPYNEIACDLYLPKDAPTGLKAKIILTVGDDWKFTEMSRSIALVPGEWVTISANIRPGSEDWKKTVVDESFRQDVRKLAIRIECNRQPVYNGPIYIDNIRVVK